MDAVRLRKTGREFGGVDLSVGASSLFAQVQESSHDTPSDATRPALDR